MAERDDYTPAALYARVSSDRQDVDLSVSAQLRALRDYAEKNGYLVAREFIDEAESGRIADRPQFRRMIDEATKPEAPFREILVWKFSRFTRKREHAVAFKSMLRRKGVRVVSITEHADDIPTGKLMEAIIESVDEFYSENLAQEVTRGMREASSRGFWISSHAPYGYNRVMVQDGPKKRPTLEIDPDASRIVKRMFDMAEAGDGTLEIIRTLNNEGIASPRGKLWARTSVHNILTNEAYTGTLVWGVNAKDNAEPVRVEKAFPAIVTKAQFSRVKKLMHSRAPKMSHPRRVGSTYLLSGLVKCKTCNRALSGQDAKSGQFAYYVCQSIMKRGKDACDTARLNARRFEELVVEKIRSNILTEGSITELVKVVDEEMDGIAQDQRWRPLRPVRERPPDGAGNRRLLHGAGPRSRDREGAAHPRPHPVATLRAGAALVPGRPGQERLFAVRWDGDSYRLVVPPQAGTATRLAYVPPAGVVAEFHSHGSSRSFFSATDDRDEQGFRIYGVVGRLDTPLPELSLRVGVYGHFASVDWLQVFDGPNPTRDTNSNDKEVN